MFNFFKKKEMPQSENLVEINLGENDFLIFSTDKKLSVEQRDNLISSWNNYLKDKNNRVMIIDADIKFTVVHRK